MALQPGTPESESGEAMWVGEQEATRCDCVGHNRAARYSSVIQTNHDMNEWPGRIVGKMFKRYSYEGIVKNFG